MVQKVPLFREDMNTTTYNSVKVSAVHKKKDIKNISTQQAKLVHTLKENQLSKKNIYV
jgi:hypothetical protein